MKDKILVTGSTGNMGKEVVNQLIAKGASVKAAAREPAKARQIGWEGIDIVTLDFERPDTFGAALADAEMLFLIPPPVNPRQHDMLIPFVREAARVGVSRIVNLGAMNVEQDNSLPLRKIEKFIETSGMEYTLLRPNWFMQNCNGFLSKSIKSGQINLPVGNAKVSFIDIRDIAAVAAATLTTDSHKNKAYTLTGPRAIDHHEMAALLSAATGNIIKYVSISEEDMRAGLELEGWPENAIEMGLGLFRSMCEGKNEPVFHDVAEVIGKEPIAFEQYAIDYADYWK